MPWAGRKTGRVGWGRGGGDDCLQSSGTQRLEVLVHVAHTDDCSKTPQGKASSSLEEFSEDGLHAALQWESLCLP